MGVLTTKNVINKQHTYIMYSLYIYIYTYIYNINDLERGCDILNPGRDLERFKG